MKKKNMAPRHNWKRKQKPIRQLPDLDPKIALGAFIGLHFSAGFFDIGGLIATGNINMEFEYGEDPDPDAKVGTDSAPSKAIDIPLSAKTKEEIIKRGPWYLVQIGEGMEQVGREAMLRENVLDAMEEYAQNFCNMNTRDQRSFKVIKKQIGIVVEDLRRLRDAQPEEAFMDRNYLDQAETIAIDLYTLLCEGVFPDEINQKSH